MNEYLVGDNLKLLKQVGEVDFIYLDPPYCTGRDFGDFEDKFDNMNEFVKFIRKRVEIMHEKLKPTGTIAIHVDPISSHYLKVMMDDVFGIKNYKNEIVLTTNNQKNVTKKLMRSHDTILIYSKNGRQFYNQIYMPYSDNKKWHVDERGEYITSAAKNSQPDVIKRPNLRFEWNGHFHQWWVSKEKMQELHNEGRLKYNKDGIPRIKRYKTEMNGVPLRDVWTDISSVQNGEKLNYATQKPIKLLERLLDLYTQKGDLCLDPFAGSGTLGRACIKKNRNYLLMDINKKGKSVFNKSIKQPLYKGEVK